jgi:mannose-6-phosphate isomerase-like protein (cupin superfamily)
MTVHAKLYTEDDATTAKRVGRMTFHFKVSADDTEGAYTVLEAVVPPDSGSGLHRHWSYDETARVLEGRFECYVDGSYTTFTAGQTVYWPRGAIHRFRCLGPADGRILFICSPGRGFEQFAERIAQPDVQTGTAVSGPASKFRAVAADYGIEFIDEASGSDA